MQVKVTKAFPGRIDHEPLPRQIAVGEIITGELAEVALREKWAEPIEGPRQAPVDPLDSMTIAELKTFATEKGIDLGEADKKAEIRAAIDAALAAAGND